jgi:hypothetical protein
MANSTSTTGFNAETANNLLLDAGAFYSNYGVVDKEKCLGATSGGGEFTYSVKTRQIKIDGVKGNAKGLQVVESVEITIKANMLEATPENLRLAVNGSVDTTGLEYDVISGKTTIELTDYIDNIAWVGRLSGSLLPVIIVIKNALSTGGLKLKQEDNKEGVIPLEFTAHFDPASPTTVPFEIRYPKAV